MGLVWIVQKTGNPRFPVRIAIEQEGKTLFAVRAQDSWPGQRGNVFCIRDGTPPDELDLFETIERIPVVSLDRFGKSLRITLDRPLKKRCEFLILQKAYKNRPGSYEQIFFKTQTAQREHRSRSRLSLRPVKTSFTVVIDTAEKYPWKFPKAQIEKRKLPAGDYALIHEDTILAVVERKTFQNLLTDFSRIAMLHQVLRDLETLPHPALVIEADYGDFLNPERLEHTYKPAHCYRVLSELQAMHPHLPIIFARTRKEANLWTYGFFRAVYRKSLQELASQETELTAEPVVPYVAELRLEQRILTTLRHNETVRNTPDSQSAASGMSGTLSGINFTALLEILGDVDETSLKRILQRLKKQGRIDSIGRGKDRRWFLVTPTEEDKS